MLNVHQIAHFDKIHVKQKCGGHGEFQLRFKREEGVLVKNENDTYEGISPVSGYGPERFQIKFKFEEEARMMLGVSMVQINGVSKGVRCPLFDYTGKMIVGMKKWKRLVSEAIREAKEKRGTYWVLQIPRPAGKEIFEEDKLLLVPCIGKKL